MVTATVITEVVPQVTRRHTEACGAGVIDGLLRSRCDISIARLLCVPQIEGGGSVGLAADFIERCRVSTVPVPAVRIHPSMEPVCGIGNKNLYGLLPYQEKRPLFFLIYVHELLYTQYF